MGWNIVQGDSVGAWVAQQTTGSYHYNATAIGLEREGQVVAGVIYESFMDTTITCHIAVAGRMTKTFIAALFNYQFIGCNV